MFTKAFWIWPSKLLGQQNEISVHQPTQVNLMSLYIKDIQPVVHPPLVVLLVWMHQDLLQTLYQTSRVHSSFLHTLPVKKKKQTKKQSIGDFETN